jgi:hypothetical protein
MSHTIAHRPHVQHFPVLPLLMVVAAIIIATAVIWAINQPAPVVISTTSGTAGAVTFVRPAAPPALESPVFRHALMRAGMTGADTQAYKYGRLHQVDGASLDRVGTTPFTVRKYEQPGYAR